MSMERWISVRTALTAPYERAVELLVRDARVLLPEDHESTDRARMELSVESDGGSGVRQAVDVTFGATCQVEGEVWIPVDWEPSAYSHLLPSFRGVIEVLDEADSAELSITGTYRVPLGFIGRFGDGIVGRRIAQQSLRRALADMAERLDAAADAAVHDVAWHPAAYPVALREQSSPAL